MSKQITTYELAWITNTLLTCPDHLGELDSVQKYQAFMTDLAKLICDHCGGEVINEATNDFDKQWLIGIHGNDSLPDNGGVWRHFDPDGELFDAQSPEPCFEQGHWYLRESDSALFIVPDDRLGVADTYGPDDSMLVSLDSMYRQFEANKESYDWFDKLHTNKIAEGLGLVFVYPWQRRHDPVSGWFVV